MDTKTQTQNPQDIQINFSIEVFLKCYKHLIPPQILVDERGNLIQSIIDKIGPEPDIDFLWGGRDSGKTRHIAMRLLIDCLTLPYFRCILVRKVFNTIHDSQWQQLKDIAIEWGVDHLFTFKESPLEINCINGNKFICRGMDDPGKVKSASNPSHCWIEEGNQLEQDDFITVLTSLRSNQANAKVWFSFNPECDGDFKEFWLYTMFFEQEHNMYKKFSGQWEIELPITNRSGVTKQIKIHFRYRCTWTTYRDNPYVKPARIAFLLRMEQVDPYYFLVFAQGQWGNRSVKDPYCYCFSEEKHIGKTELNKRLEIILSFDFNVNPITCGIYQHYDINIFGIEAIKLPNSNIYALCDFIKTKYNGMMIITGDATGRNTNALVKDQLNYYKVIKQQLDLMDTQIKTPTINPPVDENRVLVNSVFHKCKVLFDKDLCKPLIFDCKNVGVTDVGKIDKGDRNNPVKRADHLDHMRYYYNTFFKHVLKMD